MAIVDLLARLQRDAGTDGTCLVPSAVPVESLRLLTCTAGTAGTAQIEETTTQLVGGWRLHFAGRDSLHVTFCPAVSHADALASYPNALIAEPIPKQPKRAATEPEARELRGLIEAVYCDETDDDRADALDEALRDPAGALRCYRAIQKGKIRQEVER